MWKGGENPTLEEKVVEKGGGGVWRRKTVLSGGMKRTNRQLGWTRVPLAACACRGSADAGKNNRGEGSEEPGTLRKI